MRKIFWISVIAAFALPTAVFADSHEGAEQPAPLTDVWWVVPKRGMEAEFAEAAKKHMAFRVEAGESRSWLVFRPVIAKNMAAVLYRSCCFEYADLDGHMAEGQELGLDEDWNENVDQYVDHYHHYYDVNDWENSHWPEGTDGPYFAVTTWALKQNAGPGPGEARKKISQLAKSEGWAEDDHNWLWLQTIGGSLQLAVVSSMDSLSDMAPDDPTFFEFVTEKMGSAEDAMAMFEQFGSGFADSDFTVWVYDAELSTPSED